MTQPLADNKNPTKRQQNKIQKCRNPDFYFTHQSYDERKYDRTRKREGEYEGTKTTSTESNNIKTEYDR